MLFTNFLKILKFFAENELMCLFVHIVTGKMKRRMAKKKIGFLYEQILRILYFVVEIRLRSFLFI